MFFFFLFLFLLFIYFFFFALNFFQEQQSISRSLLISAGTHLFLLQLECVLQCIKHCKGTSCLFYIWPGCLLASVAVIKCGCAAQVEKKKKWT